MIVRVTASVLVLMLMPGCFLLPNTTTEIPAAVVKAHEVETRCWMAFGNQADQYVLALIADENGTQSDEERQAKLLKWQEIKVNYEHGMRLHLAIAAWMGALEAILEVATNVR